MFTNIFLPPGSLSGGSVLVKQLFKLVWPNIEASKFFVFVFVGDHGKLFLKISQMQVVCICYCYNFHIFLRE